ncbi:MAG: Swt1 family HEPN domain-containing protein [Limnospira sp. PMC 1286.21]|uniref:Swt1 family HEPN domain-containing protein n=1 Tax=unclassified Limnospira TaxID=2642885 RepID=UPI0028E124F6|nr:MULTISPECIES: Swt1 family HEPN domain-containing protein [unclassified Limnospira]MDT9302491.1 Swt1 family HEPN domain-containing protein [Limnospira sp. PMC 1281.21]MDT9328027.1 Swt1 family HEPN domain-containing protein [Limnospira sp. PMC 1286.21]
MAISNHERVTRALRILQEGLYPFVEREMRSHYGDNHWLTAASASLSDSYVNNRSRQPVEKILKEDLYALLMVVWEHWNDVFRQILGRSERSIVSELRDNRNQWAHQTTFSTDDAYRILDNISRLLTAISAPEASQVEKEKNELMRSRFEAEARRERRKVTVTPTEGQPQTGLKPWREIVTPHPDVAGGTFQQAEFAADLWEVYLDQGSDEYRDPTEFYRRTYLTEGLKQLLSNALLRLTGQGGDPVIELQTNFGGGKTHALLSLYHLCQACHIHNLPGMEEIFQQVGISQPPQNVNVAVLVGNKLPPSGIKPYGKGDRNRPPIIKTLWGELAWQLGGEEGYQMLREADETATNPGDILKQLFNRFSPCLILIDEWVAYARDLYETTDVVGGSFDTQFTFAQTLSESAKNAKDTLLVVSVPASDIEKGGEKGYEATDRLKNAIGRVESPWRPASAEEGFEIVRRRLFQSTTDTTLLAQRDAVIDTFCNMYREHSQEFPTDTKEANYKRRMREAYPIHPELFDRLYEDWSSLDKFQRTRGVLRLMAKVIHTLWERNDANLLIMPGNVPMDNLQVQSELTRYLEDNWTPIIDKDVDGPLSFPLDLDRQYPNFGRYSACRRVTRTIYMGSAPTQKAANRGLEDRRIKLGCVQPGEAAATFGDALRRLSDRATYLYVDNNRYWISTQPNVNRTAAERADQFLGEGDRYLVEEEIVKRLKKFGDRGIFTTVHVAPHSSGDIPDDNRSGVRLIILRPQLPHNQGLNLQSPACKWVADVLNYRGETRRYYQNTLVFLAPDQKKWENLEKKAAQYLAWESICREKEELNLDAFQAKQADTKLKQFDDDVQKDISETYQWLLVPEQPDPKEAIAWKTIRLRNLESSPTLNASKKAIDESHLSDTYAPLNLYLEVLAPFVWRDKNHISLQEIWEYLTKYPYLPRLKDEQVLLKAIADGVSSTAWSQWFAYAEGFDPETGTYQGLKAGESINPTIAQNSLIVKPDVAQKQLQLSQQPSPNSLEQYSAPSPGQEREVNAIVGEDINPGNYRVSPAQNQPLRRFYGVVEIEALRLNRDAGVISDEVIQHLISLKNTKVKITLEIQADIPDGIPENVARTIMENCQTLKFQQKGLETN